MSQTPDLSGIDFGDHAAEPASADKLDELNSLVQDLEIAEVELMEAEAVLAEKKARYKGIVEHELPDMMMELKQPVLHTSDGRSIKIKEVVRGTLPAPNRPRGHQWLMDNNHAGLVKRTIEVAFAAVEGEKADELLGTMIGEFGANARQTMKVEASTLTSFIKKQLDREAEEGYDGPKLPRDIFDVREFNHANVQKKKK